MGIKERRETPFPYFLDSEYARFVRLKLFLSHLQAFILPFLSVLHDKSVFATSVARVTPTGCVYTVTFSPEYAYLNSSWYRSLCHYALFVLFSSVCPSRFRASTCGNHIFLFLETRMANTASIFPPNRTALVSPRRPLGRVEVFSLPPPKIKLQS